MFHRAMKAAFAVMAIASTFLAFGILRDLDEQLIIRSNYIIWVRDSSGQARSSTVTSAIESFSKTHHINIGREVPDLSEPATTRHLYLAAGNPTAPSTRWLRDGYPSFSRHSSTQVHPYYSIGNLDPRGYYYVFGNRADARDLQLRFMDLGLRAEVDSFLTARTAFDTVADGPRVSSFLITLVSVMLLIGAGVILGAKSYGVRRLMGRSPIENVAADLRRLGPFVFACTATVVGGWSVFLLLYNNLNRVGLFLALALFFCIILALTGVVAYGAALIAVYRLPIVDTVKGDTIAGGVLVGFYLVKTAALFLAVAAFISALSAAQQLTVRQQNRHHWLSVGNQASYLLLNGSLGKELTRLDTVVGRWIRDADRAGQILLIQRETVASLIPGEGLDPSQDVLLVNAAYLQRQPVIDSRGRQIGGLPEASQSVEVIVPQAAGDSDLVTERVRRWFEFSRGERTTPVPKIHVRESRSGQTLFTYGGIVSPNEVSTDPILIVFPAGEEIIPDSSLTAYATQGGVIALDPQWVEQQIAVRGLESYIIGLQSVAQNAASQFRSMMRQFSVELLNLVAGAGVLVVTTLGVAIVYSRRHAQAIFAKHISGWSFGRMHARILAVDVLLSFSVVAWMLAHVLPILRRQYSGDPRMVPPSMRLVLGGWEIGIAMLISSASLIVSVLMLLRLGLRVARERSADV